MFEGSNFFLKKIPGPSHKCMLFFPQGKVVWEAAIGFELKILQAMMVSLRVVLLLSAHQSCIFPLAPCSVM
jgi:hypothetical protein